MKTLHKQSVDALLQQESKKLDMLCDRSRSKDQFASLHSVLMVGSELQSSVDLSDLIVEVECLMLLKKEAEWVISEKKRHLKASSRVIAWALAVVERKSEEAYSSVLAAFSSLNEWEYWKRVSLEFDESEYRALVRLLVPAQKLRAERLAC